MKRDELKYVLKILEHITPQDQHVAKAKAYVQKDLAQYAARQGQLRDQYESDYGYGFLS